VPDPDISLVTFRFLFLKMIQLLKILNQLAKHLIKNLRDWLWSRPEFPSRTAGLVAFPEVRSKPQKPKTGDIPGPVKAGKPFGCWRFAPLTRPSPGGGPGRGLPGALICGLFVTRYVVAGTAAQAAF
jgi:hypothetical protein